MAVEVWIRNPQWCIKECVEIGANLLAWDRGHLVKKALDPVGYADAYFGIGVPWRALAIGEQGAAELRTGYPLHKPHAVYPVWEYNVDSSAMLEELLARPVGMIEVACSDPNVPLDQRPVLGQEHRVVIIRPPIASTGPGRQFIRFLSDLQEEYAEAIVHVHGFYGWRPAFAYGFRSVDIDPRITAQKGKVMLPMGKEVTYERARQFLQWVQVLGYNPVDLEVPRNRCMFNIKSAWWAAEHYNESISFRSHGHVNVNPAAISQPPALLSPNRMSPVRSPVVAGILPGDKLLCDTCSLATSCKYFRPGEVCSIPGSEPAPLARFFKTRDSDRIIEGLGELLATNAARLETGTDDEIMDGELNPEVTKIIKHMFDSGVKLAKLVNPALAAAGAPRVNTNVLVGAMPNVGALTSSIVGQLEAQGYQRDQITPELIMSLMPAGAIEARSTVTANAH